MTWNSGIDMTLKIFQLFSVVNLDFIIKITFPPLNVFSLKIKKNNFHECFQDEMNLIKYDIHMLPPVFTSTKLNTNLLSD